MAVKKKILFFMMTALLLGGCAGGKSAADKAADDRIQIVCTVFPQYDWTANLIRGNEAHVSLTLLTDKGGDLHNFQPSALDIAKVSDCDILIYVGGESDGWVDDALKEAVNPDMRVINMMEIVSERLVEEAHIEGMKEHAHRGEHDEPEYDEHVWLSLGNAESVVESIAAELAELDSGNAGLYQSNLDRYADKLKELDARFADIAENGRFDTLLFADRFPFRYLVEDYGLNYYAAFEGCSAETEASFETVAFLVNKLDELGLGSVLVIDGSDDRLARVIVENTQDRQQQILILDSLQSVTKKDIESGMSYLSVMEENLKVLKQALND